MSVRVVSRGWCLEEAEVLRKAGRNRQGREKREGSLGHILGGVVDEQRTNSVL